MRTLLKSCLVIATASLLTVSWHAGAASSAKNKVVNAPLESCKTECLGIKDATAYETCMINCEKTYNKPTPIDPTKKK
ncbi:MAG: hypothetical protein OEN49_09685 [Gammaproteobacteria bacterium]|nr:hypothetical protein [Gammaproteobacteria bacterium]